MATDTDKQTGNIDASRFARQWHYRPPVPIKTSPLFQWPLNAKAIGQWMAARWLVIGENLIISLLVVVVWHAFQPSLEQTRHWAAGWFFEMPLRNFLLISIVAGGCIICCTPEGFRDAN